MSILLGLAAAVCWRLTDLQNGVAARAQDVTRTLLTNQAVGLAIVTVLILRTGNVREILNMNSAADRCGSRAVFGGGPGIGEGGL